MPSTPWRTPGTVANSVGSGPAQWAPIGTASLLAAVSTQDETQYARAQFISSSISTALQCTNFGFAADLPATLTFTSIELRFRRSGVFQAGSPTMSAEQILIYSVTPPDMASYGTAFTTSWVTETVTNFSGEVVQGVGSMTRSEVASSSFGCGITVNSQESGVSAEAYIDFVEMRLNYTVPGAAVTNLFVFGMG